MMKRAINLSMVLLAVVFGFVACSKDDESDDKKDEQAAATLVGKWEWVSSKYGVGGTAQDYYHECSTKKDYWEFKSDKTMTGVEHDAECSVESFNAQYSVSGDKFTISNNDGSLTYTFKVSGTQLTIEGKENMGPAENVDVVHVFKKI